MIIIAVCIVDLVAKCVLMHCGVRYFVVLM